MHRRTAIVSGLAAVLALSGTAGAGIVAAQTPPALPAEACTVLATVGSTAAGIQTTVESQTGQALPVDLAGTVATVAEQAGCGADGGGADPGGSPPATPAELCALLAGAGSTAAGVQAAVEAQAGQPLPLSLGGTIAELARSAGCAAAEPTPIPGGGNPLCDALGGLAAQARAIQETVEGQTGQALPADLAGVIRTVVAEAGCAGGGGGWDGGGDGDSPPAEVCGVLATVGLAAGSLQSAVESQAGQALPVDLDATIADVAAQAGCESPVGADPGSPGGAEPGEPGDSGGDAEDTEEPDDSGGATVSGGADAGPADAEALVSVEPELPRTGATPTLPIAGAALLGLGALVELARRRLAAG